MELKKIQKKIESKGYFTYFIEQKLVVGLDIGKDDIGTQLLKRVFSMEKFDNNIVVQYNQKALIKNQTFNNESELLSFVDYILSDNYHS